MCSLKKLNPDQGHNQCGRTGPKYQAYIYREGMGSVPPTASKVETRVFEDYRIVEITRENIYLLNKHVPSSCNKSDTTTFCKDHPLV